MLGKKEGELSFLSKGSFIIYPLPLISGNPDEDLRKLKLDEDILLDEDLKAPLRYYFIRKQDEVIYKVIFNLFSAVRDVFPNEWEPPKKFIILSKTTGYGVILRAFLTFII
ncbi:hypothetical protein [Bacillus subtilis]|uniref:hypothetical protein n=1 Tax=Bacillus subtilis TaxID=1423 RepID=UPI0015E6FC05|nr:hypothetical protein [Bacillus subtilis]QOJ81788.1 hypothetical protein IHV08_21220 [Bacillus subtilis]